MALPGLTAMATRATAQNGRLDKDGRIHWDAFLEGVAKEASRQHLDEWNEVKYLNKVKALAQRLHLEDPILLEAFKKAEKGIGNGRIDFDRLEKHQDFQISYLQFEKGEKIRHHDHPGMTGVLLCATGELLTENYTRLDEERDDERLLLKTAGKSVLKKGMAESLTSTIGNIHRVEAHALTQIIDIFAPPYTPERIKQSHYFEVDDEPFEQRKGVFEATVAAK